MKLQAKKIKDSNEENLYGLLSSFKSMNTYVRILESEKNSSIVVQLTDNPGNWANIPVDKYKDYKILRRLEVGVDKMSMKYLKPRNIFEIIGPKFGIPVQPDKIITINKADDGGYFILETNIKYKEKVLEGVKKILNLKPQRKYEILEKSLAGE